MSEQVEEFRERYEALKSSGELPSEAQTLLEEMLEELAEARRSNKALRRAVLKTQQGSGMSTRLREALYE